MHPVSTPSKHQKTVTFSDVFRGRERVHLEQIGQIYVALYFYTFAFENCLNEIQV